MSAPLQLCRVLSMHQDYTPYLWDNQWDPKGMLLGTWKAALSIITHRKHTKWFNTLCPRPGSRQASWNDNISSKRTRRHSSKLPDREQKTKLYSRRRGFDDKVMVEYFPVKKSLLSRTSSSITQCMKLAKVWSGIGKTSTRIWRLSTLNRCLTWWRYPFTSCIKLMWPCGTYSSMYRGVQATTISNALLSHYRAVLQGLSRLNGFVSNARRTGSSFIPLFYVPLELFPVQLLFHLVQL